MNIPFLLQFAPVARSTRAWIETEYPRRRCEASDVARSTRAWIETKMSSNILGALQSHALRVRGLKLLGYQLVRVPVRRTLYACVD